MISAIRIAADRLLAATIAQRIQAGETFDAIASTLGVSHQVLVKYVIASGGLDTTLQAAAAAGQTCYAAASRLGLEYNVLARRWDHLKLPKRKPVPKGLSPEKIRQIHDLRLQGFALWAIVRDTGVCLATVRKWVKVPFCQAPDCIYDSRLIRVGQHRSAKCSKCGIVLMHLCCCKAHTCAEKF